MVNMPVDESRQDVVATRVDHEIRMTGRKGFRDLGDPPVHQGDVPLADQFHGLRIEQVSVQDVDDHLSSHTFLAEKRQHCDNNREFGAFSDWRGTLDSLDAVHRKSTRP